MSKIARRSIAPVFMMVVLLAITDAGAAEITARQGFYVGADIGVSVPDDLESTRTNNGIGTNCDQWLGADMLNDGRTVPFPPEQCSPSALPKKNDRF